MKWIITADLHCYNSHLYSLPVYNGVPLPGELEFLREKPYWHLLTDRMIDSLRILHHIYSLALHQYLKLRLPDYRYSKHFGGVFYVFVRGVDPERGSNFGVYRAKPAEDLIEAMSREVIG